MSTHASKGTLGYRAPELLREISVFSAQGDIFALGCILYELSFDRKTFPTDFSLMEYMTKKHLPEFSHIYSNAKFNCCLDFLIRTTLQVNWWERPAASDILDVLNCLMEPGTPMYCIWSGDMSNGPAENSAILSPDDSNWKQVLFQPFWYIHHLYFTANILHSSQCRSILTFENQDEINWKIRPSFHCKCLDSCINNEELHWKMVLKIENKNVKNKKINKILNFLKK